MATIDSLQVEITAITKDFNRQIDGVKGKLGELGSTAEKSSGRMMAGFDKVGAVANKVLKAGVVGSIAAIAASIPGAVKRIDTLVAFPRVLEAMGGSAEEAASATDILSEKLTGLPTPLQDGAAGVQALVSAGLGINEATDVFLAFNNATLAASTEVGAAQGAFTQLIQSISKGKIEGQEWNSIVSAMPTAFQALSKESGLTRDELRELYRTDPQQLLDDLVELNEKGGGGLASLEEQARAATGGIGTAFANMKNSITRGLEGIVKALGNGDLEAGQRKISDAVSAIGRAFGDALLKAGEFIGFLIANKDIFAPIAVAIGTVVAILTAWNIANKLIAISQALLNAVLMANPIGLVILAVAALVAGLVYFFTQTEIGRKIFETAMNAIKDAAMAAVDFVVDKFNAITGFFSDLWQGIKDIFNGFINFVKDNWFILLLGVFTGGLFLIVGTVIRNWDKIKEFTQNLIDNIINFFSELPGKIGTFFSNAWNKVKEIWSGVGSWFGGVVNSIVSSFRQLPGRVKDVFKSVVSAIKSIDWTGIGMDIIKGIGDGIAKMGGWLADKAKAAVGEAKDQLKSFLGIASPSKVMRDEIGKMMGEGVGVGIDKSTGSVVKSALKSAKSIMGAYGDSLNPTLPSAKQLSGKLDVNMRANLSEVSSKQIPVNVQLDGETLLSFVIDGVNGKAFMHNQSQIIV